MDEKRILDEDERETEDKEEEVQPQERINPNKVRSTSIAGLRKKLLEELGE